MSDNITTKDCIEALSNVAEEIGKSPTQSEYLDARTSPHPNTISRKFDSWNEAKEKANLEEFSVGGQAKSMNVDYFKEINTPRKAYWIGLFFADGFVTSNKIFGIKLVSSDGYLLESLKDDLDSDHSLSIENPDNPNWSETTALRIGRSEFVETLISHGLDGDKTSSDSIPDLSKELQPHFIRGMFDGDGHISYNHDKSKGTSCRITGVSLGRFRTMSDWIPFDTSIYHRCDDAFELSIGVNERPDFFHYIYPDGEDTTPKLARKYCTFKQYI